MKRHTPAWSTFSRPERSEDDEREQKVGDENVCSVVEYQLFIDTAIFSILAVRCIQFLMFFDDLTFETYSS